MSVVWSILALIIAGVVCYFIYEEYIVDKPEESEAEKEIEADLMALASESGMSEFDSLPDSRKSGAAPAISVEGAAVIGETEKTAAPAAATPVAAAAAVADVIVDSDAEDAVIVEDDSAEAAADDAVADEAVDEAAATVNTVVVEDPADEEVAVEEVAVEEVAVEEVAVEEVAVEEVAVEEDVVVAEQTVAVPLEMDDLTKIKGIGKVYAQRLNEAGITSYQQIVDTDVATLEEISKAIPAANAYDWARQARKLSDG